MQQKIEFKIKHLFPGVKIGINFRRFKKPPSPTALSAERLKSLDLMGKVPFKGENSHIALGVGWV